MKKNKAILLLILITFILSACTVQIISPYNGSMMSQLQTIQRQVNTTLITSLQNFSTKKSATATRSKSNVNIQVVMTDLISTAKAIPNNETTTAQLVVLKKSLTQLSALHKKGFSSKAEIKLLIATINDDFTSVYQLQDLKKSFLKTGLQE
jgi:hypothetical protein